MSGALIVGAGPGLGSAVARRFAREGMPVTLIARTTRTLKRVAAEVAHLGGHVSTFPADSTNESALRGALDRATEQQGIPDVVVYNAALIRPDTLGEATLRAHVDAWAVNVVGAVLTAAQLLPAMAQRGSGSFLVTGGMPEPKPGYTSLSLGKAGVRTLIDLLAEEYGPQGIHAASVTVDGPIAPGTGFDPDDIADHYWRLHPQVPDQWERDVLHTG